MYRRDLMWIDDRQDTGWYVQHAPATRFAIISAVGSQKNTQGDTALDHHREMNGFLAGIEKRAYHLAVLATGNKDDALDIVQDTMFSFVEHYGKRPAAEWGPLFRPVLHSHIQDWRRREAVRRRFRAWFAWSGDEEGPDPMHQVKDEKNPGPAQSLQYHRSLDALGSALRTLPARQQQAFTLRILEGLEISATATIMRCSAGSVKTHLSRAVHTLRDKLEAYRS